jgi:hypothetical protein
MSPFRPEHVNASDFPELEAPSTGGDLTERPFEHPRRCAARRWPAGTAAARVHRRSRTPTRPLSVRCRERLRGRVRCFGFCRWMSPRARPRTFRTSRAAGERPGRLPCSIESHLPIGQPPKVRRVRGRETPCLDTPHRDCSRRRLRPNPDRFGHLLSRTPASSLSGVTWGESDAAFARRACKAREARGPCGARFPRRNRTLTNPRGLPSLAVRGANGDRLFRGRQACRGDCAQRLFHQPKARARDARTGFAGSATRRGRAASCSITDGPQRPLTTSAFE